MGWRPIRTRHLSAPPSSIRPTPLTPQHRMTGTVPSQAYPRTCSAAALFAPGSPPRPVSHRRTPRRRATFLQRLRAYDLLLTAAQLREDPQKPRIADVVFARRRRLRRHQLSQRRGGIGAEGDRLVQRQDPLPAQPGLRDRTEVPMLVNG